MSIYMDTSAFENIEDNEMMTSDVLFTEGDISAPGEPGKRKKHSARRRIEDYFERQRLRELIYDPVHDE